MAQALLPRGLLAGPELVPDLTRDMVGKEIAEQLGLSLRTIYRWLDREDCPAHQPEPKE